MLVNALEDHRVDSLWGKLYQGSFKLKKEMDQEYANQERSREHKSLLSYMSIFEAGLENTEGKNSRFKPYFEEAFRKVRGRGPVSTYISARWLVTGLVTELLREAMDLPPQPPQPPPQDGEGDPGDQGRGDIPNQQQGGAGGEDSDQKPWEQPSVDASVKSRAQALSDLLSRMGQKREREQHLVDSQYSEKGAEARAQKTVQDAMNANLEDQEKLEEALQASGSEMDKILEEVKKSLRQKITDDEWLRKGAMAKVVFRDIRPSDVTKVPLNDQGKETVRRLRAAFNRILGKRRTTLQDVGAEIDVPADLEEEMTGVALPSFKSLEMSRGFKAMVLLDKSGSMGGYKWEQAEQSCLMLAQSLNYPFVELDVWGFTSHNAGEVTIARFDKNCQAFESPKDGGHGSTPLHIALRVAAKAMGRGDEDKHLFVITDGFPVFNRRDGREFPTTQLMNFVKEEVRGARKSGVEVTGVMIGGDLESKNLTYMFGPRGWRRMSADRLGRDLVHLVTSGFTQYLKNS